MHTKISSPTFYTWGLKNIHERYKIHTYFPMIARNVLAQTHGLVPVEDQRGEPRGHEPSPAGPVKIIHKKDGCQRFLVPPTRPLDTLLGAPRLGNYESATEDTPQKLKTKKTP